MLERISRCAGMILNPGYIKEDRFILKSLIRPLIVILIAGSGSFSVFSVIFSWRAGLLTSTASFFVFIYAYILVKRDKIRFSSHLVLFTMVADLCINVLFGSGIYDVSVFLFPSIILLGSMILEKRPYTVFIILSGLMFASSAVAAYIVFDKLPLSSDVPGDIIGTLFAVVVAILVINLFTYMFNSFFRIARENEEKFRVLTENLRVGITAYSEDGKLVYANRFMTELSGYTNEELLEKRYTEFIHPDDRDQLLGKASKRLSGEDIENGYEFRSVRKDGTVRWLFISASKVNLDDTNLGLAAFMDIQDKKDLEEQILVEKEQLSVTLKSIKDGVVVVDGKGIITLANKGAENIFEIPDLPTGFHVNTLIPAIEISGTLVTDIHSLIHRFMEEGKPDFEGKLKTSGGKDKILYFSISMLGSQSRSEHGEVVVVRDVTMEREISRNSERMERLEALGLLAGGIAHDFNNILTGISGNIDLLNKYLKDSMDGRVKERLDDAKTAAIRAGGLTRQLLTFSQGGIPVKELVSLPSLIRETVSFVVSGTSVGYDLNYPDDLWEVSADYSQISQVVQNLAINSEQAVPAGSGMINISMKNVNIAENMMLDGLVVLPGRYVEIEFSDNGAGMKEEVVDRIFDPYFTTKESGTGLGLATVFSIINQHGGYITVRSEPEEGTVFTIYLPAAAGAE